MYTTAGLRNEYLTESAAIYPAPAEERRSVSRGSSNGTPASIRVCNNDCARRATSARALPPTPLRAPLSLSLWPILSAFTAIHTLSRRFASLPAALPPLPNQHHHRRNHRDRRRRRRRRCTSTTTAGNLHHYHRHRATIRPAPAPERRRAPRFLRCESVGRHEPRVLQGLSVFVRS